MRSWAGWAVVGSLTMLACGPTERSESTAVTRHAVVAPLASAYCNTRIVDTGIDVTIPTESDYLPHVIQCENGGAGIEALKAQAIAARSVVYYNMATQGSICDSQGCQVYGCGATPRAEHYQAVAETSGLYLSYDGMLTYGFYVDGDHGTSPPTCTGSATSGNAGASRERWITYNDGKLGGDVSMTPLGFIPTGQSIFGQNRGCMGQWGARCLEDDLGRDYVGILRFYYGADIEIRQAPGSCIEPIDRAPEGALDDARCDVLTGWVWDPDEPDASIDVVVAIDLPPGAPGSAPATLTADEHRDDLCTSLGSCAHGFSFALPEAVRDGAAHTIHVLAVNTKGQPATDLSGSPRTMLCATADPADAGPEAGTAGVGGAGGAGPGAAGAAGREPVGAGEAGPTALDAGPRPTRGDGPAAAGCACRQTLPRSSGALAALAGIAFALAATRRRRLTSRHMI